jgi:uncharacterized protein (DUF58 family)
LSLFDVQKKVSSPVSRRPPPGEDDELFDDDFQRKLDYLALVSRRVFAGRLRAERRTKKSGSGVEFADHRDYVAGDDFRYLDWNVYQRFGRLLVRLYEEEEDLSIYIVVDSSSSMGFSSQRKFRYAKRLAAALAYVGLANLDRITIVATTDRIEERMPTARGKARIFKVLQFLRGLEASGVTDLGDAMKSFVAQHKRRGLVIVLSDLYDPQGFERGINVLRYAKFEPFVLHVVDPNDAAPKLSGDVRLYDCETGEEREVTVTAKVLTQFRAAYEGYLAEIKRFCTERQVPYVPADVNVAFDELVLRVLRRGGFIS